jgi:hypothetical protein
MPSDADDDDKKEQSLLLLTTTTVESSRLPTPPEVVLTLARLSLGLMTGVACLWVGAFVCLCVLLARANTPHVHSACAGFYDFMVCATVLPLVMPCFYCCGLFACVHHGWRYLHGGSSLVLGILCMHNAMVAGDNADCVDALRRTTEPFPLLLYAAYAKMCLFFASALHSLGEEAARR